MTVKQLIERLQELDPEGVVSVEGFECFEIRSDYDIFDKTKTYTFWGLS